LLIITQDKEKIMERTIKPTDLNELLKSHAELTLLDVRRKSDLDADQVTLLNAEWRDPEKVNEWAQTLPKDKNVVIFCARGGSVSKNVLDALLAMNVTAQYIEGGIEAWKASGGSLIQK
jgi:rhodanese-related sulfurtransferase